MVLPGAQADREPSARHIYAINFLILGIEQIGKIDSRGESAETALDAVIQKPVASAIGASFVGERLLIVQGPKHGKMCRSGPGIGRHETARNACKSPPCRQIRA
jgi:hypothetical protein